MIRRAFLTQEIIQKKVPLLSRRQPSDEQSLIPKGRQRGDREAFFVRLGFACLLRQRSDHTLIQFHRLIKERCILRIRDHMVHLNQAEEFDHPKDR